MGFPGWSLFDFFMIFAVLDRSSDPRTRGLDSEAKAKDQGLASEAKAKDQGLILKPRPSRGQGQGPRTDVKAEA